MNFKDKCKTTVAGLLTVVAYTMLFFAFCPVPSEARDYNVDLIGHIEYNETAELICTSLSRGGTLTISSGGGSVSEMFKIAECARELEVTIRLHKAASAAAILTFATEGVCFTKDFKYFGLHSPATYSNGVISYLTVSELRDFTIQIGTIMKMWGNSQRAINEVALFNFITPHDEIMWVRPNYLIVLLGDKYTGTCDDLPRT